MEFQITTLLDFLNTHRWGTRHDVLADPGLMAEWLRQRSLISSAESVSIHDVARAVEFREALRHLITCTSSGDPIDAAAAEVVNRAARTAGFQLHANSDGVGAQGPEASGLDAAIVAVLAAASGAMPETGWSRLKTCRNPECRRVFYDESRNRSGVWCEMSACGNRMKARRFRRRRQEDADAEAGRVGLNPEAGPAAFAGPPQRSIRT